MIFNLIHQTTATYSKIRFRGYRLTVHSEYRDEMFLSICCVGVMRERPIFIPVISSPYAKVFRFSYGGEDYFHKTYLPRSRFEWFKSLFRGSRAERALEGHRLLEHHGFSAPRIVLTGRKGSHNFTVSQAVCHQGTVSQYLRRMQEGPHGAPSLRDRRIFFRRMGHIIGQLHHKDISHGDLRLGNMLLDAPDPDAKHCIFLDNERTVRHRWFLLPHRFKNLVQMNMLPAGLAGRTDRMRFFEAYLQENPGLRPWKKLWLKRIVLKTRQRLAKKEKGA